MFEFEIPEGFSDNQVAIQVPEEHLLEFLEYLKSQGYNTNINFLFCWAKERTSLGHQIYFYCNDYREIHAFTEKSYMYREYHIININSLKQSTANCEELLNLL